MKRSEQYRQKLADAVAKGRAIMEAAETNGGEYTAEQQKDLDQARADIKTLGAKVTEWEAIEIEEAKAPAVAAAKGDGTPIAKTHLRAEDDPRRGFRTHRDFLLAAMDNSDASSRADVADERLRPLALTDAEKGSRGKLAFMLPAAFTPRGLQAAVGSDEQGTYSHQYGGVTIPESMLAGLRMTAVEGDPTETLRIPMQTPVVKIIARTDKNHTTSVSGGLTVSRRAETGAFVESRMSMEKITLGADTLAGLSYETEELLTDSPLSFIALIDAGFRDQFATQVLKEKLRGTGAGELMGVLNSPCKVQVSKESGQVAATINATNVIKMRSRCWNYGRAVWLANHDTLPQLLTLSVAVGTAGQLLYTPGTSGVDNLLGRPIFYSEHCSAVGTEGDLILGVWGEYLEGLYQPLQSAESIHVRFLNHERTFKFWLRNAGAPWWRAPLTPAQSAATLSPFVTLATRS